MSTNSELPRRVHGRHALERAVLALLVRAVHISQQRAMTPADRRWAARVAGDLAVLAVSARDAATEGRRNNRGPLELFQRMRGSGAQDFISFYDDIRGLGCR